MKSWREIAIPHSDVLKGTLQQSEFAADITAVRFGKSSDEYKDAKAYFQRTFITEGMRRLLTEVSRRLNGQGGEPVVQLQTSFGGGKTHTMLAVYHLAQRKVPLKDLAGVPAIVEQAGLMDVPKAKVAVLDGNNRGPAQPWKHGKVEVKTLWGELAWQLGEAEAFEKVQASDAAGTSPGKEVLRELLERHAPCVVLVDELVAYIRQFPDGQVLTGGSYDSNLSFIQALTEAVKLVPNAVLLASLPDSDSEAGSPRGLATLKALEKVFGRVQSLWKPVAIEEAFEIVRMRLFEPIRDLAARDAVCRAFADAYQAEGAKMPSETHEGRYLDRLRQAYPIHPEVFERLYEDWSTIDGFQRTRGVLKLMSRVIYRLWNEANSDALVLPSSLPLASGDARNELTYLLPQGWDAVLDRDVDGPGAETWEIDKAEPRFGQLLAARKVARTLFLATAPSSVATLKQKTRGVDRARVLLGCVQPGQSASVYSDALNRLVDRLHYLNASGDKAQEATRYWFDTRATLRREMEDRKGRFDDEHEVQGKIKAVLTRLAPGSGLFEGTHVFVPHSDVPDDGALRLVVLGLGQAHSKQDATRAAEAVREYVRHNGAKPRHRGNRLLFLAPDQGALSRLRDCVRVALAWASIVEDISEDRLTVDNLQQKQAKKELETAEAVVPKAARECFKWLLCPTLYQATDRELAVEPFPVPTSGSFGAELSRTCTENELVIGTWSPFHLRTKLQELYWKPERKAVGALAVWGDFEKYLYLPRLANRHVFEQAVVKGAGATEFFGTALAENGGKFEGFKLGRADVQLDDTLLLIEPSAAQAYEATLAVPPTAAPVAPTATAIQGAVPSHGLGPGPVVPTDGAKAPAGPNRYFASVEITPSAAKLNLVTLSDELIALLAGDPKATVKVTVEVEAQFPQGASPKLKRDVSENVSNLKSLTFKASDWE